MSAASPGDAQFNVTRRTVKTTTSYREAERAVDWLSDHGFAYLQGGRRDFSSVATTTADRYEVQVDERFADEAERLLAQMNAAT
jgi:hypothetical protein